MTNENEDIIASKRRSRGIGGLILIIVGACLLLQRLDLDLPYWLFSWQVILIVIGVLLGIKHNFRGGPWWIMIGIGGIFLAGEILNWPYNTAQFIWPVVLIMVGLVIVLKKQGERAPQVFAKDFGSTSVEDDVLNISAVFSGVNKIIVSKDFRGGHVSSIFGGSDLNFIHADIQGTVVLDITAIFGGCEIVVPSNWTVKVDISTIMGGVEDKRPVELLAANNKDKVLLLKGSCIFGGVEVKSYS